MKSKIGFHIIRQMPGQKDKIIRAGVKVLKILEDASLMIEYHNALPNSTIIGRSWRAGGTDNFTQFLAGRDPRIAAQDWMNQMRPLLSQAPFGYWESFNEMSDWDYLARYGLFEAERVKLMSNEGFLACVGNFSTGSPPLDFWPRFYPALEAAHKYKAILGLHEYSALYMDTYYNGNSAEAIRTGQRQIMPEAYDEGWLTFLYRKVWREHVLPNNWTNIRIVLTETGLMSLAPQEINAIVGYPVGSWTTCREAWSRLAGRSDTEKYYVEQLQWQDRQMQKDTYVLGSTIFTWGSYADSQWVVDEIDGPVADMLVDYIGKTVDVPVLESKPMRVLGIDVSKFQGTELDWQKIAAAGVGFVFLRYGVGDGTDGTGKDPTFDRNYAEAKKAGILVGAYWYMWSVNIPKQVELFTKLDPTTLDLPMVLDVEQTNITEANLYLFLREIERITGRTPLIYTRKDIWHSVVGTTLLEKYKRFRLWVAQYPPSPVGDYPTMLPNQWTNWEFWQWASDGQVPGHIGNIDMNYFNGSLEDLKCRYNYPEMRLEWPVDSPVVTQPFGNNPSHYGPLIGAIGLGHEGIDFRAPTGSNVYACEAGVVKQVFTNESYGLNIRIDHQNGLETIYAHLQTSLVGVGQRVVAKQKIGLANNTGNSSGSHLHLAVKLENATVNRLTAYPSDFINPTGLLKTPTIIKNWVPVHAKTTAILNIRSGPGLNYTDIGDIPADSILLGIPTSSDWWEVRLGDIEGWALASWLEVVGSFVDIRPKATMTTKLNIRSGPGTSFEDIGDILPGEVLQGKPTDALWWEVRQGVVLGWALAEWLEIVS